MTINKIRYDLTGYQLYRDGEYIAVGEYASGCYRCTVTELDPDTCEEIITARLLTPADLLKSEIL